MHQSGITGFLKGTGTNDDDLFPESFGLPPTKTIFAVSLFFLIAIAASNSRGSSCQSTSGFSSTGMMLRRWKERTAESDVTGNPSPTLGDAFIVKCCIDRGHSPPLDEREVSYFAPVCKSLHTMQKLSSLTAHQIRCQLVCRASSPYEFQWHPHECQ